MAGALGESQLHLAHWWSGFQVLMHGRRQPAKWHSRTELTLFKPAPASSFSFAVGIP